MEKIIPNTFSVIAMKWESGEQWYSEYQQEKVVTLEPFQGAQLMIELYFCLHCLFNNIMAWDLCNWFHQYELLSMQQRMWAVWSRGSLCSRPDLEGGIWGREATPRGKTVGGTPLWHVSSPSTTVLHQVDHWTFLSTTSLYLHGLLPYLERGTLFSRLLTVKLVSFYQEPWTSS